MCKDNGGSVEMKLNLVYLRDLTAACNGRNRIHISGTLIAIESRHMVYMVIFPMLREKLFLILPGHMDAPGHLGNNIVT
jgi:hypothetical protein